MAISSRKHELPFCLVHHSDRGIQYCCADYMEILKEEGISISMTQSGSPYDNALAERVNGIIKMSSILKEFIKTIKKQKKHYLESSKFIIQNGPIAVLIISPQIKLTMKWGF